MKDEIIGMLILAFLGFLIGGIIGHFSSTGWSPACWYGAATALGIIIIPSICD